MIKPFGGHKPQKPVCATLNSCVASIMDLPKLPLDFKELLNLFRAYKVEYLLIGGYAVAYHGYPRVTQDLDLWIAVHPDNASRVAGALHEFIGAEIEPANLLHVPRILRMGLPPLRIEITNSISGVDFDDCYPRRIETMVDGVLIAVIGLEDLKNNKRASGRSKDLADLDYLP